MAHYLEFATEDGNTLLIEVAEPEQSTQSGMVKAGLNDRIQSSVSQAQNTFQSAISTVKSNALEFINGIKEMDIAPDEVEIEFGLKATAEAGNFAIGKINGDINYSVKLKWINKGQSTS